MRSGLSPLSISDIGVAQLLKMARHVRPHAGNTLKGTLSFACCFGLQ